MSAEPIVVVQGASAIDEIPGLERIRGRAQFRFGPDEKSLAEALPGADVLLGWDFASRDLRSAWNAVDSLSWIHWCGAGVDAALFPALRESAITITNARGVFDGAMAEYTLGLILAFAKQLPETLDYQRARVWKHRLTETIAGRRVLVVGVGSIGRAIARMLRAAGLKVTGVGRRARSSDPDFDAVHAVEDLDGLLPDAHYVVLIAPLTPQTSGLMSASRIALLDPQARIINLGRGALVDEQALIDALREQRLGGAALDVFETEPLPADSPLWALGNVIVSPHMSGDFHGHYAALAEQFVANFERFVAGEPLHNVVDKHEGFVPAQDAN